MTAVFYSADARRLHIKQPRYEQGWCGAELQVPPIEHRRDFRTPICADCLAILDAKRAELRAQLDAAQLNEWGTAPEGEHVMVTLRTVGWRVAGLWEWDDNGYWDVLGWQPLPDAPGDGGEEAGNPLDRLLPTGENVIAGIKRVQMWNSPAPGDEEE